MTYEYRCAHCKHEWETEQKITDEPVKRCPECMSAQVQRLISGGGHFQLHGEGWAKDGYK